MSVRPRGRPRFWTWTWIPVLDPEMDPGVSQTWRWTLESVRPGGGLWCWTQRWTPVSDPEVDPGVRPRGRLWFQTWMWTLASVRPGSGPRCPTPGKNPSSSLLPNQGHTAGLGPLNPTPHRSRQGSGSQHRQISNILSTAPWRWVSRGGSGAPREVALSNT